MQNKILTQAGDSKYHWRENQTTWLWVFGQLLREMCCQIPKYKHFLMCETIRTNFMVHISLVLLTSFDNTLLSFKANRFDCEVTTYPHSTSPDTHTHQYVVYFQIEHPIVVFHCSNPRTLTLTIPYNNTTLLRTWGFFQMTSED